MTDLFVVLSPDASANALGRALSNALVARQLGECMVFAARTDSVWQGVSQFPGRVMTLPRHPQQLGADLVKCARGRRVVLWSSKSLSPLPLRLKELSAALRQHPHTVLVDFDDDDVSLAAEFVGLDLLNHLRLNPLRDRSAYRIQRAQRKAARLAHGRTTATHALSESVPGLGLPTARIPHVRVGSPGARQSDSRRRHRLRVGFLGTWRPHKGVASLISLIERDHGVELVTFRQPGLPNHRYLTTLPHDTPLQEAYRMIDVLALPMSRSRASEVQFPAKLVDAFAAGVPVAASPTLAIKEIAGDAVAYIDDWNASNMVVRRLREVAISNLGRRGRAVWKALLTPEAASNDLVGLLEVVGAKRT